jgi:hypothetical protein
MAKKLPLLLVATFLLGIHSLTAQTLDLTAGLGKFTWGMSYDDAMKIAVDTYGPDHAKGTQTFPQADRMYTINIGPENNRIELDFVNDHLFQIGKTSVNPIDGMFTKVDLNAAKFDKALVSKIKVPEGVTLQTNIYPNGSHSFNNEDIVDGVDVSFIAENHTILNAETAKIRAAHPDLSMQVLTTILSQ